MIVVQYLGKAPERGIAKEGIRLKGTQENSRQDNGPAKLFKSKHQLTTHTHTQSTSLFPPNTLRPFKSISVCSKTQQPLGLIFFAGIFFFGNGGQRCVQPFGDAGVVSKCAEAT
jgi:hypothetical protein